MFRRRSRSSGDGGAPGAAADGPGAGEGANEITQTQSDEPEATESQGAAGGSHNAVDPADGSITGALFALPPLVTFRCGSEAAKAYCIYCDKVLCAEGLALREALCEVGTGDEEATRTRANERCVPLGRARPL